MVGDYDKLMADFSWLSFLHRELEIISSNASSEAWDDAVALVMEKKISLSPLFFKLLLRQKVLSHLLYMADL